MLRKILIALIAVLLLVAAVPVSNAGSDNGKGYADIKPYNGLFGADSPFYGVKLFVQHVDVSLEGNVTMKLQKQQNLAWQRLSEALAVTDRNDPASLKAALDAFVEESKLSSKILDSDLINDTAFLEAWNNYDDMEGFMAAMMNNSSYSRAITDQYSQTLDASQEIKNGKPFIYCNNTTYFIPPGQMKKLAQGGQSKTPAGLNKTGYVSPEPIIVKGTVLWPWDDDYSLYFGTNESTSVSGKFSNHGNSKDKVKGNGNGNGNGKK
jgi:hypothetical protein